MNPGLPTDLRVESRSPAATLAFGRRLGALLRGGDVVRLSGELGSGKTCLVKGVAEGLGVAAADEVVSPTFLRVEMYGPPGRRLVHIDAYRMAGARDLEQLGAGDLLGPGLVTVVEWPERVEGALPRFGLRMELSHAGPRARVLVLRAEGSRGGELVAALAGRGRGKAKRGRGRSGAAR